MSHSKEDGSSDDESKVASVDEPSSFGSKPVRGVPRCRVILYARYTDFSRFRSSHEV